MSAKKSYSLLDKIKTISTDEACENFLGDLHRLSRERVVRIAFVNAHAFNLAMRDNTFYRDIMACDYVLRDGSGMKILYRLMSRDAGLNMNGTDFIPRMLTRFRGENISLMGTAEPYLSTACAKISSSGAKVVAALDGYRDTGEYADVQKIHPASLIILAMGMPKQERVADVIAVASLTPCVIVCGGAILDFMGGKVTRAPDVLRRYGLEWTYRLLLEPKRLFKRYVLGNAVFLIRAMKLALFNKRAL